MCVIFTNEEVLCLSFEFFRARHNDNTDAVATIYRFADLHDPRQRFEELHVYACAAPETAAADAACAVRARRGHPNHRSYILHVHDSVS